MAGPGGGPPRRSHKKSRKGCEACKRRHIRCDENFPQCRNCTKHKVRCPYNLMPVAEDRSSSSDKPNLLWTPEIEASIAHWQRTGIFPFPSLAVYPSPAPQYLSAEDLRLIHHVASVSHQMMEIGANGFTLWTRQIPTIIRIAASHNYVLHALLAFSASHIASMTNCPKVGSMAYAHQGAAFKGLQEAIGTFSKQSADAILAASLVLSWQATDWRSWTQLMQGTSSVIEAMEPWKRESQFGDFIAESCTFPTAPPSPRPDHRPSQPCQDDLEAFQCTLQQLHKVESYLKLARQDTSPISTLVAFLKGARKINPASSVVQQFERLHPLRQWLFWLPVEHLQKSHASPSSLVIIAHYYTAALLMERLFPEIGAAYFGSLSIGPVEEIARRLLSVSASGPVEGEAQTALHLMEFPLSTVDGFRSRMGWTQPVRTPSFPQFDPPKFFSADSPSLTPSTSCEYLPQAGNLAFSYSTEDLSVVKTEPGLNGGISPIQISSPFANPNYLGIPSPSYGGYSPASSTFGDYGDCGDASWSETDEFGSFDCGLASNTPMPGGTNSYVGTPCVMSTTPTYPPPEDALALLSSSLPNLIPSPFLRPEQLPPLPPPESPVPLGMLFPDYRGHRHNLSTASAPPGYSRAEALPLDGVTCRVPI